MFVTQLPNVDGPNSNEEIRRPAEHFYIDFMSKTRMELFIFARFHAREGQQEVVAAALCDVFPPSRAEPGCLEIEAYFSIRDPQLFFIHSRWIDEAAFDTHAELPHTVRFVRCVQPLIDHAMDVTRTRPLDSK